MTYAVNFSILPFPRIVRLSTGWSSKWCRWPTSKGYWAIEFRRGPLILGFCVIVERTDCKQARTMIYMDDCYQARLRKCRKVLLEVLFGGWLAMGCRDVLVQGLAGGCDVRHSYGHICCIGESHGIPQARGDLLNSLGGDVEKSIVLRWIGGGFAVKYLAQFLSVGNLVVSPDTTVVFHSLPHVAHGRICANDAKKKYNAQLKIWL